MGSSEDSWAVRRRPGKLVFAVVASLAMGSSVLSGCGDEPSPQTPAVRSQEPTAVQEPTTVEGLAAALVDDLGERPAGLGGNRNSAEGWMAVEATFERDGTEVPVGLMIVRKQEGPDAPSTVSCNQQDRAILDCQVSTAPDGSRLGVIASTEDVTGGVSSKGFFVHVVNAREGHMVLVSETLPDRRPSYLDLSGLPVGLDSLKRLATDPLVGFTTSKARNDAGKKLPNFSAPD